MTETYILENWATTIGPTDGYTPPECLDVSLVGEVHNHPNISDGHKISTSPVVRISGRTVTTRSGSVYTLGKRLPEFEQFLLENGYVLDEENPIKFVKERTPIYKKIEE